MSAEIERCHAELAKIAAYSDEEVASTPAFLIAMGEIDWRRELDLIREVSVRDDWVRSSEFGGLVNCSSCDGAATTVHVRKFGKAFVYQEIELFCDACCPMVLA